MAGEIEKVRQGEAAATEEAPRREGWLRWIMGWVVGPGLIVAAIVGLGAHVGANNPEGWFARLVLWAFG